MADPDLCADRGAVQPDVVDLHLHTGETKPGLFHVDQDGGRHGDPGVLLCESFPRRDRRHEDRKSVPAGEYGDGGPHDSCGDCDIPVSKTDFLPQKKQVLYGLQGVFIVFNCQTPAPGLPRPALLNNCRLCNSMI